MRAPAEDNHPITNSAAPDNTLLKNNPVTPPNRNNVYTGIRFIGFLNTCWKNFYQNFYGKNFYQKFLIQQILIYLRNFLQRISNKDFYYGISISTY